MCTGNLICRTRQASAADRLVAGRTAFGAEDLAAEPAQAAEQDGACGAASPSAKGAAGTAPVSLETDFRQVRGNGIRVRRCVAVGRRACSWDVRHRLWPASVAEPASRFEGCMVHRGSVAQIL